MSPGVVLRRWLLGLAAAACGLLLGVRAVHPAEGSPPPSPQWVGAADARGAARLTWVRNAASARVRVYRRGPGEPAFRLIGETAENVYVDPEVVPGGAYAYRLRAVSPAGLEGPPSIEISVRIAAVRLRPPVPPVWEGHIPLEGGVALRWEQQAGSDVIAYNVYRRTLPAAAATLVGSTRATTFRDEGLARGKAYAYSLTALDSSLRETARSPEIEVTLDETPSPAPRAAPPAWKVRRTRLVASVGEAEGIPLLRPADVVAGPLSGDFYLSDSGRRAVFVYSADGVYRRAVGSAGAGERSFDNVIGLAVDARETLYAVDAQPGVVQAYGRSGRAGRRYEVPPPGAGHPGGIIDAAIGPDGRLFVVDNRGDRVLAFGTGGTVAAFGGPGGALGAFSAPTFCAFDGDGSLYVADAFNARVQVLGRGGEPLRAFGVPGRGPGGGGGRPGAPAGSRAAARGASAGRRAWR